MNPPSPPETVGIVTVLYNSQAVLSDFFGSLNRQTFRSFTLYAIDNCSPDGSVQWIKENTERMDFPVILLSNSENGGVAQGNNIGIRAAMGAGHPWILLSNNDTVLEPDTLERLLSGTRAAHANISVPKILIQDTNRIWFAGGYMDRLRGGTKHTGYGKTDCKEFDTPGFVEYAPSCFMLIHRSVFDKTGCMDERFFIYYDDTDFITRARLHGIRPYYLPDSRLYHKESCSTGGISPLAQYWLSRNLVLYSRKHCPGNRLARILSVNLLILFCIRTFTFTTSQWRACWKGYKDGLVHSMQSPL